MSEKLYCSRDTAFSNTHNNTKFLYIGTMLCMVRKGEGVPD